MAILSCISRSGMVPIPAIWRIDVEPDEYGPEPPGFYGWTRTLSVATDIAP